MERVLAKFLNISNAASADIEAHFERERRKEVHHQYLESSEAHFKKKIKKIGEMEGTRHPEEEIPKNRKCNWG